MMCDQSRTGRSLLLSRVFHACAKSRGAEIIASFVAAAVSVAETMAGAMKVEDGSLCCSDVDDEGCCTYCCFIDFETRL